jgi:hypothetical protein
MPIFYNSGYPTPTSKNTINSVAVGGGIRDFLLNLNLLPQYPQIPTAINGSPKIGQPVLDTTVGTGNVLIPIGLPLETNGIIWKDLNVIYNTFQNDSSLSDVLEEIEFIPAITNPDFGTAIWPINSQYPIGANTQVEQYGLKGKTEYAEYRKDNVTKNLYLDSTSQIDVADFITLTPLDISQQLGNYADVFGGLNNGGAIGDQAVNVLGSVLNGQGVGLGAGGSVIPNFDFKSSLLGRVLGGTGFLKDTKLGNVGAQQLSLALANNAAFNVQQEILGTLNLKENIYSLIKDGELAGFRPSYKITVPKSTGGQILNGITRVLGFQIPRSYLDDDGSIFQSENGDAGNINRANSMIENTGKGQVKSLINSMLLNLSVNSETQNSFRSGYAPAFVDKDGTPMSNPKIYAYYYSSGEGTANGDINKILGNIGDVIPSLSYNREAETKNSGFESPEEILTVVGYPNGYNDKVISSVLFSWEGTDGDYVNSPVTAQFLEGDKKSLLIKTQTLFSSKGMKTIVSAKGDMDKNSTQIQTANGYGFSKGSAVMSKDMFNTETGVWKGEKNKTADETYCRSWTTHDRYDSITKLIRHKALYSDPDVAYRHQTQGSVLDGPFVKIGPYANDTSEDPKKFMFSIENLAWKDKVGDLPPCEQGPGDLISGEKGRIMWFPPYEIQFSENNTVNWEETNFIGRGEPIYTYNNTKRSGQLSFKIIVDHPSYFNAFNARKNTGTNGPDDNFIASFFAGCVDVDKRWADKLTTSQISSIENRQVEIPQPRQNPTNPTTPETMSVYYPNDVKNYVSEYEDGKKQDDDNIDYQLNPSGFGEGLGTYEADVTQKDVNGVTKTWPDRFDYGLNSGRNSTKPIPTVVIGPNACFGFNDPAYANNMVEFLKLYPWSVVNFTGYASKQGNPSSNTKLAEERAKLLKDKLIVDWGNQLGLSKDKLEKRFIVKGGKIVDDVGVSETDRCVVESKSNPNPPTDVIGCKLARKVEISVTFSDDLKAETEKSLLAKPKIYDEETFEITKEIRNKFYTECDYFERLTEKDKFVFDSIREKIRYFHPAFHSTTPEGLNSRLTFLLQCTRQGPTLEKQGANNLAFGRPPVCILRIGDFYHTKIVMDNVNISYEPLVWDLNPEGIGAQPMIANVDITFNFLGGSSLMGPINKLQNALSFNYFANTHVYDPRADYISKDRPIWNVKDENGNELPMSMIAPENKETGYYINDGITSYDKYTTERIIEEELKAAEGLVIDQITDEEFVNDGIENITEEPSMTGATYIIITEMICEQDKITKTDSKWLLPIKLNYLPIQETPEEAVNKLESGYDNYKIKVKDVNSNEMYEDFISKDKFIKFFTLNDFSEDSKFVVPIKGAQISDSSPGINDSLLKENFYVSLIKDGNELYKLNIKL